MNAFTSSRGEVRAVSDEEILAAYSLLGAREGVFCEPASAASVAGLLKYGAEGTRRLRAHRPRAEGPADGDEPRRRRWCPCEPDIDSVERAVLGVRRHRLVRVPASSANLGPGYDVLAAALSLHARAGGGGDGRVRGRVRRARGCRSTARTCACGRSRRCIRPTG